MLSPINVTFDPSNGAWSVYFLEVLAPKLIGLEEYFEWKSLIYGFQSVNHAISFCQPQIASPFDLKDQARGPGMTNLDRFWEADLKAKNDFHPGACRVRIKQLLMVLK